ncbi:MAG: hypothetical protein JWM60_635 [Solirubrobacterales bacterium]|nr:hypothetical protein [Solirubrobacterales bacterium]
MVHPVQRIGFAGRGQSAPLSRFAHDSKGGVSTSFWESYS